MTQNTPVELDLRRDLPKVRKQYHKVLAALETASCDYRAPCVIGAMVPPAKRASLQSALSDTTIGSLIGHGCVTVPTGQRRDFTDLQKAFDSSDRERFETKLEKLEAKYLESVSA